MLSRTILRQASRLTLLTTARVVVPRIATAGATQVRFYSNPIDDLPPRPNNDDPFSSSPSLQKIKSSPEVLQVMMEIADMMQSKGYVKPGEQPGMLAMMKIMADKELRQLLVKLKTTMDEQGIQLDQSEIMKFAETLGLAKKS
ncbi:hypothetical protein D0Z00_002692 [Geotrichum galactomycetum]|uniref:Uncharacterized protein n=1 Tax=Geotrichum galactomycetum TaxID=27317 RepID=A0ACB6V3F7_9ASCO|nr:hypothetical protein D0Z00_002692 [Geotrichum candidum]